MIVLHNLAVKQTELIVELLELIVVALVLISLIVDRHSLEIKIADHILQNSVAVAVFARLAHRKIALVLLQLTADFTGQFNDIHSGYLQNIKI